MEQTGQRSFCKRLIKEFIIIGFILVLSLPVMSAETETDFLELCKKGTVEEIANAIDNGAKVNQVNKQGATPLMYASAYNTNPRVILLLHKVGAALNYRDNDGETALFYAVINNGNPYIVEILSFLGININIINKDGDNALIPAIKKEREDVVRILLNSGINVNIVNKNGWTALMYAVRENNDDILEMLLRAGANIDKKNSDGQTVLMLAIEYGQKDMVELLLTEGADIRKKDKNGCTPLHYAARYYQLDILEILLKQGASINVTDNLGHNAFYYIIKYQKYNILTFINFLLHNDINVNHRDIEGKTPLMYAARYSSDPVVLLKLIEAGANINAIDKYKGMTPLMIAARYSKNEQIIFELLEAGADPTARDDIGKRVVDYLEENDVLKGTDAYWTLYQLEPEKTQIEYVSFKSKEKAGMLAAIIPSAGHAYANNWPRGSLFLLGEGLTLAVGLNQKEKSTRNTYLGIFAILKIWEVYDAIQETEKYNKYVEEFNQKAEEFNQLQD